MNYAGILAGGSGSRMGKTERPKQFFRLGPQGTPVIIHTVAAFLASADIDHIVIASPKAWIEYTQVLIAENCSPEDAQRVHVVAGGADRSGSLEAICAFIEEAFGLSDDDLLVSHDAVRPFITQRIIADNVRLAREYGCTDTVVPATDTIVVSTDGEEISDIPPRSQFFQGQTPQSFFIREYREAYASLTDAQRAELTDACKVYRICGKPVRLVMGEYSNIKLTTPHDLYVAESILAQN